MNYFKFIKCWFTKSHSFYVEILNNDLCENHGFILFRKQCQICGHKTNPQIATDCSSQIQEDVNKKSFR